jgi:glycopeptide antibiotics resistance protein
MNPLKKLIEWFEKHKKISFVIILAILITMTYFSSIPGSTISFGSIWPSIIYHFTIFAGFAFFFLMFIAGKKLEKKTILTSALISLLISISDEIHQSFVPLRSPSIQDVLTDMAGVMLSIIVYVLIKKTK